MMSAADLATFGRAHMGNGVGPNGVRILSEESARAMRSPTSRFQGLSFGGASFGLGWMVTEKGVVHHGGGGPGIVSWLYVHPESDFLAVVMTNAEHGMLLVNEFFTPWLDEVAGDTPMGIGSITPTGG